MKLVDQGEITTFKTFTDLITVLTVIFWIIFILVKINEIQATPIPNYYVQGVVVFLGCIVSGVLILVNNQCRQQEKAVFWYSSLYFGILIIWFNIIFGLV